MRFEIGFRMSLFLVEPLDAPSAVTETAVISASNSSDAPATAVVTAPTGECEEELPFRLDPVLSTFWGDEESYRRFLPGFEERGFADAILDVAVITGDTRKPLLFDGKGTYWCWRELSPRGDGIPLPPIRTTEFACEKDVWVEMVRRQLSRRNLSEAERAKAVIRLVEATTGMEVSTLKNGRPTKGAAARQMSAKKAAAVLGVGEYSISIVTRAKEIPEVYERLFSADPEKRLSLRQADDKLKEAKRAETRRAREEVTKERGAEIALLPPPPATDTVNADGIYTGDFRELMPKIPDASVSLVLCSPPYPIKSVLYDIFRYTSYTEYLHGVIRPFFAEAKRVLRPGGRIMVNFDSGPGNTNDLDGAPEAPRLPVVKDYSTIAEDEQKLLLLDHKSWYKQNCSGQIGASGSSRSCRAPRGNFNNEFIFVWAKDQDYLDDEGHPSDIGDEYAKFCLSDWFIQPAPRHKIDHPDYHPCPYPEELCYRAIKLWCYPNDVVLDPFNGSGTTTFVARALGRRFIGLDQSPLYCDSARSRLARLDGLTPEEMRGAINRFCPKPTERSDGR